MIKNVLRRLLLGAGRPAAEERHPIPLTADDEADVAKTVVEVLAAGHSIGAPVTCVTSRGIIVRLGSMPSPTALTEVRRALAALGYVLADADLGKAGVIVTGRDPFHVGDELTVERVDAALDYWTARRAELLDRSRGLTS
ncbi:hypothetical protein ACWENQ_45640 [Nonomuraea sp. NPDC004354]